MQYLASQPVSVAKILDTSIKLYKASFPKLIGYFLILTALYMLMTYFVDAFMPIPDKPDDLPNLKDINKVSGVFFVVTMLSLIFYSAIIYRVDNVAHDRDDSFSEGLGVGLKTFPRMVIALILYSIALVLGFVLLIVPGLILTLSLYLYIYLIVLDDMGGYESLKASHDLVWGQWWKTATVFTIPGVILIIIFVFMGMVAGFVGGGSAILIDVVTNLVTAFATPFFYIVGYVLYHDLKLRKSGSDLEKRLAK